MKPEGFWFTVDFADKSESKWEDLAGVMESYWSLRLDSMLLATPAVLRDTAPGEEPG